MKKFGAIGVFGRANAGKSTLTNLLVGEKVSIVSKRPQTTRKRMLGILTQGDCQLVFCDTPGLHKIKNRLDMFMHDEIKKTLAGLQIGLYLVDLSDPKIEQDQEYLEALKLNRYFPTILVLNKSDRIDTPAIENLKQTYSSLFDFHKIMVVSAKTEEGTNELLSTLLEIIPEGSHAYDEDMYTQSTEREIVEEVVREVALKMYREEIPHSIAVQVEQFKERENGKTYIEATINVEKEAHKKIIIGKNGSEIKKLGSIAREKLNTMLERDIFLELWIKVRLDWRKKEKMIKHLGYKRE